MILIIIRLIIVILKSYLILSYLILSERERLLIRMDGM